MMTPENWIITTLGEIGTWASGGTPSRKNSTYYGGDIPWVKTGDLNDSLIHNTLENLTKEGVENSSAKIFPPGTLLIAMYGATIGKLGILSIEASTNQACGALLPVGLTRHLIPFVFYYLLSERENIRAIAKGGAQPNISQTLLKSYPFPLPPLQEQSRINAKIESLQSRRTKVRKALVAISPLLEKFRQSVLYSAFRGDLTADWRAQNPDIEPAEKLLEHIRKERRKRWEEDELAKMKARGKTPKDDTWKKKYKKSEPLDTTDLPELPEGWCWVSVGQIFEVGVGATPRRSEESYWGGEIPWVSSSEVAFCRISSTREHITEAGLKNTSTTLHPAGTVLIGMIGEGKTRGQVAILDIEACNNQNSAAIRVSEAGLLPEYVYRYLQGQYEITRTLGAGNNQPALNKTRVQNMVLPIAPLAEQEVISRLIEKELTIADNLARRVMRISESMLRLNQSILSKAFRGELVPQDPNDEPASQLLERIKQEKASLETGKKKRTKKGRTAKKL